jgi:hypothetical protein
MLQRRHVAGCGITNIQHVTPAIQGPRADDRLLPAGFDQRHLPGEGRHHESLGLARSHLIEGSYSQNAQSAQGHLSQGHI